MEEKNNKQKYVLIFTLVLVAFLPQIYAQESNAQSILCEQFIATPLTSQVNSQEVIDTAIICKQQLTNEQFQIASPDKQKIYVFSKYADFYYKEQNELFIRTILGDNISINAEHNGVVRAFLLINENYSTYDPETNFTAADVFEKTANESIEVLNDNLIFFNRYFDMTSRFVYVRSTFESYDMETGNFVTRGPKTSTFSMKQIKYYETQGFSDFFTDANGKLGAQKYMDKEICTDCDYYFSPDRKSMIVESGTVKLDEKSYYSDKPFVINILEDTNYQIKGDNIMGMNLNGGNAELLFKVDGIITVKKEDEYILGPNTIFHEYEDSKEAFNFRTGKETHYFSTNQPSIEKQSCSSGDSGDVCYSYDGGTPDYNNPCRKIKDKSCIHYNPAYRELSTVKLKNNDIVFNDEDKTITHMKIEQIPDESEFIYKNKNGMITFSNSDVLESYKDSSNHESFPPYSADITIDDEQHTLMSDTSTLNMCSSQCTTQGALKRINSKYPEQTKINGVKVITVNIQGVHGNADGSVSTFDGMFVEKNVKKSVAGKYYFESSTQCNNGLCVQNLEDKQTLPPNVNVLIITGHHYAFDNRIWSDDNPTKNFFIVAEKELLGSITSFPESPNVQVLMFSSCNTVKNPKEEKRLLDKRYSENLVASATDKFPNLRLIIGYDGIAPGLDHMYNNPIIPATDKYIEKLLVHPGGPGLTDFSILENGGFQAFGDKAINIYKVNMNYLNTPTEHSKDFTRLVAYYYKDNMGQWHFVSNYYVDENEWHNKKIDLLLDIESDMDVHVEQLENAKDNPFKYMNIVRGISTAEQIGFD